MNTALAETFIFLGGRLRHTPPSPTNQMGLLVAYWGEKQVAHSYSYVQMMTVPNVGEYLVLMGEQVIRELAWPDPANYDAARKLVRELVEASMMCASPYSQDAKAWDRVQECQEKVVGMLLEARKK